MFPKLLLIVLTAAAVAAALLVIRQQRIETAHELVEMHHRIEMRERALWMLQAEIAERCGPPAVRELMDELGEQWRPIVAGTVPDHVDLSRFDPVNAPSPASAPHTAPHMDASSAHASETEDLGG